jgi:hypothetical protein
MGKENEKMDVNELNQWIETEEGKKWGDEFKAPLLNKRDELLAALKEANGKLTDLEQRSAGAAEELSQERAALSALVVDKELTRMLKEAHIMEQALPSVIAELKNSYGITVKANGPEPQAIDKTKGEDGTEKEAGLAEIVSEWATTSAARQVLLNASAGGGASGSAWRAPTTSTLDKLSGPALAKLSDAEFQAMRQSAIAQGE